MKTRGVVCLVGSGGNPTPIPDSEIELLQLRLVRANAEPHPFLNVGDHVRVTCGPLVGLEGILLEKRSQLRLVVCMELLRQAVSVQVDANQIEFVARKQECKFSH
jgi:transcription antitermination factor NusG